MGMIQETGRKIGYIFAVATDWLLIAMGVLLILIALKSIDVAAARYVVIGGGVVLSCIGFRYRYRRLKKVKKQVQ